jgi:hypothetical protein
MHYMTQGTQSEKQFCWDLRETLSNGLINTEQPIVTMPWKFWFMHVHSEKCSNYKLCTHSIILFVKTLSNEVFVRLYPETFSQKLLVNIKNTWILTNHCIIWLATIIHSKLSFVLPSSACLDTNPLHLQYHLAMAICKEYQLTQRSKEMNLHHSILINCDIFKYFSLVDMLAASGQTCYAVEDSKHEQKIKFGSYKEFVRWRNFFKMGLPCMSDGENCCWL